jgi:hypothetical protein
MKRSASLGFSPMFRLHRPIIIGSLTPWLAIACISGEDLKPMGTAGNTAVGNTGGAFVGNTGGSRTTAVATGGAIMGNTGGSVVVGNGGSSAAATGGTAANITGGQSSNATGGIAATGGEPSTAPAPSGSLGVYIDTQQGDGFTGDQALHLHVQIVNTASASQDLSNVTMRYWYVDDGWGSTQLVMENDYVSIGYSNQGTVTYGGSVAVTPAQSGADHYFEFSFTGTLAAVNDKVTNDKFHVGVRIHASNNSGTANVANDYSVLTTTGYNDRITLYSAGSLIWGTEPGSSISGTGGASSVGGSTSSGGSSSSDTASTGGDTSAGGTISTGGETSATGGAATGGDTSAGGTMSTGGDTSATTGGDTSASGGDTSIGGDTSVGGDSSQGGST